MSTSNQWNLQQQQTIDLTQQNMQLFEQNMELKQRNIFLESQIAKKAKENKMIVEKMQHIILRL